MDLEKYRMQTEAYLNKEDYINAKITREEIEAGATERYFALFAILGEKAEYAEKFCERMAIHFEGYDEAALWQEKPVKDLVEKITEAFPYLFYFLDKDMGSIKVLTIIECGTGECDGDNCVMDKAKFDAFLKRQLKGILQLGMELELSPEQAELVMDHVYDYFGM